MTNKNKYFFQKKHSFYLVEKNTIIVLSTKMKSLALPRIPTCSSLYKTNILSFYNNTRKIIRDDKSGLRLSVSLETCPHANSHNSKADLASKGNLHFY